MHGYITVDFTHTIGPFSAAKSQHTPHFIPTLHLPVRMTWEVHKGMLGNFRLILWFCETLVVGCFLFLAERLERLEKLLAVAHGR